MYIINIRGILVDILLDISPDVYGPYVITDRKGLKKLIVQCQNSIYGTITANLLYYKNFGKVLEDDGYEFNPYEPFFANNIIKCSQMKVCFNNCKLSHNIPKVVGNTITYFSKAMAAQISRLKNPHTSLHTYAKNVPEATRKKIYTAVNGQ